MGDKQINLGPNEEHTLKTPPSSMHQRTESTWNFLNLRMQKKNKIRMLPENEVNTKD